MAKILIIEDDKAFAERVRDWLVPESHNVEIATSGEDGLQLLFGFRFDLAVLDWNLPGLSGLEMLKRYRFSGGKTPIIFLTGEGGMDSKLDGLMSGADDYMTKPVDMRELSARITGILRRPKDIILNELSARGAVLMLETRTLVVGDSRLILRPRECALLEYLFRHPNRCYSAKSLLNAVWPSDSESSEESVRTCMRLLRNKLGTIGREDLIKTVLGSGYMVETD